MDKQLNFSKRQQAFSARILTSLPSLLDDQMQFYVAGSSFELVDHLKLLPLIYWRRMWSYYYRIRWGIDKDDLDFIYLMKKPEDFNYLLVVNERVTLDSIFYLLGIEGKIEFSDLTSQTENGKVLLSNFFIDKKRENETYALWHKHSLSKFFTSFDSVDILGISNQFKDKTMDLLEILVWFDFVTFMKGTGYRSYNSLIFGEENTRCVATLSKRINKKDTGYRYASILISNKICRVCRSTFFGGMSKKDGEDRYDLMREIIF